MVFPGDIAKWKVTPEIDPSRPSQPREPLSCNGDRAFRRRYSEPIRNSNEKNCFVLAQHVGSCSCGPALGSAKAYRQPHLCVSANPHRRRAARQQLRRSGLFPVQLKAAYGFNNTPNQGQGQIIGIVDAFDNPNAESDLQVYDTQFNLPVAPPATAASPKSRLAILPATPVGDSKSILDVQQAHSLAPAAKVILVEANSNSFDDLLAAVDVAVAHGATQISMSWSGGGLQRRTELRLPLQPFRASPLWLPPATTDMVSAIPRHLLM